MALLILLTGMLKVDRIVSIIGGITPFLILFVMIISVYSFLTVDGSFTALDQIAKEQPTTLPNWFISCINYVSFNTAVGASMALVMGGAEADRKTAALGGLAGGLGIGILILLSHLAIFSKIGSVSHMEMPMLAIVNNISPVLGILMSIVLFAMIFNTAIGMFFSFTARFAASFAGFTDLVSYFYPLIGYLGLTLIGVLIITPIRIKKAEKQQVEVHKRSTHTQKKQS